MSDPISHLTPKHALNLVAQHGGKGKTAARLRGEAAEHEAEALRCERVLVATGGRKGNRRRARDLKRSRDAEVHRANAKVALVAAREVEKRKASTVGEALKPAPVRWLRRLFRRQNHMAPSAAS